MKTTYDTAELIGNLIIALVLFAVIYLLTSCGTPKAFPAGPDPLDTPGGPDTTLPTIRQAHMRDITGNPVYR